MTQDEPNPQSVPAPRRRAPRAAALAAGAGVAALALIVGLYAARNLLAREALVGWLRARGAPAEAEISGLGLSGLTGRIVVGPPERPDFTVETSEIGYRLTGPWSGEALGLEIRSVRLVRPVLRARFRDGQLSLGSLDPVIAELRKRPPRPDVRQPLIRIENGRVSLDTDYGRSDIRADARLDDGKLLALDARLGATSVKAGDVAAELKAGALKLRTRGDRVDVALDLRLDRLTAPGAQLAGTRARLTGQLPYPDLKRRRGDGAVALSLSADADDVAAGAARLRATHLTGAFEGEAAGWIDTLVVSGHGRAEAVSEAAETSAMQARGLKLTAVAQTLNWIRPDGDRIMGDVRLDAGAATLSQGPLRLQAVTAGFEGPAAFGVGGARVDFKGGLAARGALSGLGPPAADDVAEVAAIKRALSDFRVSAPGVAAALDAGGLSLDLTSPLRVRAAAGGEAVLTTARGQPLYRQGRGGFDLAVAGGGLPQIKAAVTGYRLTQAGIAAPLWLAVRSDFDPVRGGAVETAGELRIGGGATQFVSKGCADVAAERLEMGENDVEAVKAELCPDAKPLFVMDARGWRVQGRARGATARVGLMQTRLSEGAGVVEFGQTRGALGASANLEQARLTDLAPGPRFNPLQASGPAILRDGVWQAAIVLADPQGRRMAEAQLSHDVRTGVGEVNIDTGALAFAEGGLQPAALSPLAAALGSPVTGHAGFNGEITWSPEGVSSRGALTIPQLDFISPAGAVRGVAGEIVFTSLAPLAAPPGQRLRATAVDAFAPLGDVKASLAIADETAQIRDVEANTGGGRIRIPALDIPFQPGAAWGGTLEVENVQVEEMVERSPFGDRMDLKARLSGQIPFSVVPQGLRISHGELHAVEAGRLSIRREALVGMTASQPAAAPADGAAAPETAPAAPQAPPQPAPNAFSDFAYQALENLAFDTLQAEINSLPEGRLGILFRIKGENQPPERQVLRLGLDELISRSFMQKAQPLPSGTKVDLTLDTSINLDQLLGDVAGYRELRSSGGVQAEGAKTAPESVEQDK